MSHTYTYDSLGSLATRADANSGVSEAFQYGALNRIIQVTLDTPAGALPLTGTRYMSHVFDDYYAGAKSVNGTPMGNGNLMYTVSLDSITGRNTVRWESYTSFNMPLQMRYANLANATATSSAGTVAATPVYSCPDGQTLNGTNCLIGTSVPATFTGYSCATGQTLARPAAGVRKSAPARAPMPIRR